MDVSAYIFSLGGPGRIGSINPGSVSASLRSPDSTSKEAFSASGLTPSLARRHKSTRLTFSPPADVQEAVVCGAINKLIREAPLVNERHSNEQHKLVLLGG